jgi:hypothetical protein
MKLAATDAVAWLRQEAGATGSESRRKSTSPLQAGRVLVYMQFENKYDGVGDGT